MSVNGFAARRVRAGRRNLWGRWRNSAFALLAALISLPILSTPSATATSTPYTGTPAAVPGRINAETFDNGGSGVAYFDTTAGNAGGQVRATNVDIEKSSEGGYDIGWTAPKEWLNYTVSVRTAGSYTIQLRVASPSGGSLHLGFNGPSSGFWKTVAVPATGGWQTWKTVSLSGTLGAGTQQMTVLFDTGGTNLSYVNIAAATTTAPPTTTSGTTLSAATWNIKINDGSATHARVAMDTALAIGPRPQVITIQEAYASLLSTYLDELQKQTGHTWYGAFATECAPGQWSGSACKSTWYQGVAILSSFPILNSSSKFFPFADCYTSARVGLRAAVNVNGVTVQVFTTHLQTGGCADDKQSRFNSMSQLKSWASGYSKPQIVSGDFNADPDQIDTTSGMLTQFVDTWSLVGSGRGLTALGSAPTMKLDYWFTDSGLRAQPISSQVFSASGSVSDHFPVQTTFVVK
jgi:endonuclease/exonuclease/phosphatase family metal-dependent hydrolase